MMPKGRKYGHNLHIVYGTECITWNKTIVYYVCTCICACVCVCVYVYAYVCVCVYV